LLRVPWFGRSVRMAETARFSHTLAILARGGVPLLSALDSASRSMTNLVMRGAAQSVTARVREGASLARALAETHAFSPLLVSLVESGEVSGRLAEMLERAARLEDQARERRLAIALAVLEPALILMMGVFVLLIVLAMLLPIIEINQLVR
jgi:general secretion pathway protein F